MQLMPWELIQMINNDQLLTFIIPVALLGLMFLIYYILTIGEKPYERKI